MSALVIAICTFLYLFRGAFIFLSRITDRLQFCNRKPAVSARSGHNRSGWFKSSSSDKQFRYAAAIHVKDI